VVGENNYCVAIEDAGSCDKTMRPAFRTRMYSPAISVCRTDCTDSATFGECLYYDNVYM
jgi:hypothetical protein